VTLSHFQPLGRWLGWLLAVNLCAVIPADAQPFGLVRGSVKDTTGAALPGVTLTLRGAADRKTETGPGGDFAFEGLPSGEYELTAVLAGFVPARRTFRLVGRETVTLPLTLWVQVLEQAFVTASKIGERDVQTTPLAVSVLSAADLQRVQAHTVEQLAGRAPSVTFSQNTGFAQLTIRGIGTNAVFAGSYPSSAVYVDGVYLARPAMVLADFMELDRVEVLRGPQGTLYGRNAVGGALNIITKNPTNQVEASARVDAGSLDLLRAEARLSGPIIRDKVLGSVSFLRGVRDGFVRDLNHPDHPLGGEDVTAARGKLHVVFNRRTDLLLSGDLTHRDPAPLVYAKALSVKPGFQVDNPADLHEVRASTLAEGRNLQYGGAARLSVNLAPRTILTSLTAFRKLDYKFVVDADITELNLTISNPHEMQHQISEELTVSQQRGRLTWIGGLFVLDEVDRQPTNVPLPALRLENRLLPEVAANSTAGFGQATVGVTERASVTAGLRYTRERKTIDNAGGFYTLDQPPAPVPGMTYAYRDAITHTAWTPKVGLDIRVDESTLAYVSATRGFKSGGFNLASQEAGRGYAPEWAWSYEGGLKTVVANGRVRLNAAVFQTDYTDLQVMSTFRPGVIDISNAAAATIRGFELEGEMQIRRALHGGGHLAWLDATYDRYVAVGAGGLTADVAGHRLSNAPEWSGRLWLEWNGEIGRAGVLSLRADSRWQSTVFFTPFNDDIQRQRPYGLLELSVDLESPGRGFSVGAYARNLTNEDYITGTFSSPPPAIGGRPGDSRQIGVQLTVRR
jgi:iron complex outermembrane recepter protein